MDIRKLWDNPQENAEYKNVCDVYGAEHLARLIGTFDYILDTHAHKPLSPSLSLCL